MKKLIACLMACLLLFSAIPAAFAATLGVDESRFNYRTMTADVALATADDVAFYGTVDGSTPVALGMQALDPSQVGHIIVVDLAYAWTSLVTEDGAVLPALNAYLNTVDSSSQVKFILAGSSLVQPTNYMSRDQAAVFIASSIKLPEKNTGVAYGTSIDAALKQAFTEAASLSSGPVFKTVFALVDPANPNIGHSATEVRNSYKKSGNAFPVLIAPIYPETYMANYSDRPSATRVNEGMTQYQTFATNNDAVVATLNATKDSVNTTALSAMLAPRSYYTLDLSPLMPLIDYTLDAHTIELITVNAHGTQTVTAYGGISSSVLPTPMVTTTPEPTPEPYRVKPGDSGDDAKLVILQLYELYYLQVDKGNLPGTYDESCEYAFMEFCRQNDLPREGSISAEAYELLMSGNAIPAPTAEPTTVPVTPTPSPSPTPVPRIYVGANSTYALRAISRLKDLYYLDANTRYSAWDSECMLAFLTLCQDNDMAYEAEYLDDNMYDWLISGSIQPKATATPVPVVTETPAPAVPADGYALGAADTTTSTFIAQMQTVLQSLGLYRTETTIGTLDQPTLDAVALYCQCFGLTMQEKDRVERPIVNDILQNGGSRQVPTTPTPSVSERFSSFLQRDALHLGTFAVKMWMLLALVVFLLFVLLLIIILTNRSHGSTGKLDPPVARPVPPVSVPTPAADSGMSSISYGGGDETLPLGRSVAADDDATRPVSSGMNVTLTISGGPSAGTTRVMIGQGSFVIGRRSSSGASQCDLVLDGDPSVSRQHAVLTSRNGQLYLFNKSSNGTTVNGMPVQSSAAAPVVSDETMPLNGARQQDTGYALKRGDSIGLGGYRLTVNW